MRSLYQILSSQRHKYAPLPVWAEDGSSRFTFQQRFPLIRLLVVAIVLASISLNVVFVVLKLKSPPVRPFDDFQHLNISPLVSGPVSANERNAIVTTLFNDAYAPAVITLGHSIRKVNTAARMIVLYIPGEVSPASLCLATASGFEPHPVSRIAPPRHDKSMASHFADAFTKLSLWSLDVLDIDSLVFLDADTLVVQNFDELFSIPFQFAAAPDVWSGERGFTVEFNSGVMLLRPNSTVFQHMLDVLPMARFPLAYADQGFLNQYFAAETTRLPVVYNANLQAKTRFPKLWDGIRDDTRIIHYTMVKPFVRPDFSRVPLEQIERNVEEMAQKESSYVEEVLLWGEMWRESRTLYSDNIEECLRR